MKSLHVTESCNTYRSQRCPNGQQRQQQRVVSHLLCRANYEPCRTQQEALPQDGHSAATRRQSLAGCAGLLLGLVALPSQAAVTSDLIEGTGNVLNIGMQEYGIWMQSIIDDISNDDQTGVMSPDQPAKRRFGGVSIPGLSSFSFIHGTLVGAALILLLALSSDKQKPGVQQQQPQEPSAEQVSPEVEAALRKYLSSPETSATFHDPAVHAAIQEVKVDIRNITKYKNDPAVMQAFEKLLEIEGILERL